MPAISIIKPQTRPYSKLQCKKYT